MQTNVQKNTGNIICGKCHGVTHGTIEKRFFDDPRSVFDRGDVIDLSRAIRRGDSGAAEHLLDRMLGEDEVVRDWISQGRHSA